MKNRNKQKRFLKMGKLISLVIFLFILVVNIAIPIITNQRPTSATMFGDSALVGKVSSTIQYKIMAGYFQMGTTGGTADSITAMLEATGGNQHVKCALYDDSGALVTNGVTEERTDISPIGPTAETFNFVGTKPTLIANAWYLIGAWADLAAGDCQIFYDVTEGDGIFFIDIVYGDFPDSGDWISFEAEGLLAIYCTYTETVANTAPTQTAQSAWDNIQNINKLLNATGGVAISPRCFNVTIADINANKMNVTMKTNASGIWKVVNQSSGTGLTNGTYHGYNTSWISSWNKKYWITFNVTDGSLWCNRTKWFTTRIAPTVFIHSPINGSTGIALTPTVDIHVNTTTSFSIDVYFLENSTGNWIQRQRNSSVASNGTVKWTFTQASANSHKYWWKVNRTQKSDGLPNATSWYCFTTMGVAVIVPSAPIYFEALSQNSSWIKLNWTHGATGVDKTVVRANIDSYPTLFVGSTVYNGTLHGYNHTGLTNNTHWFYRCYAWNNTGTGCYNTSSLRSHDTTEGMPLIGITLHENIVHATGTHEYLLNSTGYHIFANYSSLCQIASLPVKGNYSYFLGWYGNSWGIWLNNSNDNINLEENIINATGIYEYNWNTSSSYYGDYDGYQYGNYTIFANYTGNLTPYHKFTNIVNATGTHTSKQNSTGYWDWANYTGNASAGGNISSFHMFLNLSGVIGFINWTGDINSTLTNVSFNVSSNMSIQGNANANNSDSFLYYASFDVSQSFLLISIFFGLLYFWWKSERLPMMYMLAMLIVPYDFVVVIVYALPLYITDVNILLFIRIIFILLSLVVMGFTIDAWDKSNKAKKEVQAS